MQNYFIHKNLILFLLRRKVIINYSSVDLADVYYGQ